MARVLVILLAFLGVLGLADDALVVLVGAAIYLAQFREALR